MVLYANTPPHKHQSFLLVPFPMDSIGDWMIPLTNGLERGMRFVSISQRLYTLALDLHRRLGLM